MKMCTERGPNYALKNPVGFFPRCRHWTIDMPTLVSIPSWLSAQRIICESLSAYCPRKMFSQMRLSQLRDTSATETASLWSPSLPVLAMLSSHKGLRVVDFMSECEQLATSSHDSKLAYRCVLERTQFFRTGQALQLWLSEDDPEKSGRTQTFILRFQSEDASSLFWSAARDWKHVSSAISGRELSNCSIDEKCGHLSKFAQKIEASSAKVYFHYYGQLLHQQNMLQDYVRTGTYYTAVIENQMDFQDKIVVDVGAGSGILSLFAAQAGARHVYAVEASPMAEYARKLIAGNPSLGDRITVIHGKVEEVDLPEKADVLISEPMGTLLLNERMLESYVIARDRFLTPQGKMFPGLGRIHMAPFSDEYLYVEIANKALFWQQRSYYGVDLTPLHASAFQGYFCQPVVDAFDPRILVAAPIVHTIDFTTVKEEELYEIDIPLEFSPTVAARVHGLACWFDVLFNGSAVPRWLSTAPGAPTTHWYQLRCVLSQPLHVLAGQPITGHLHLVAHSSQSYTIHLTMSATTWTVGAGDGFVLQTASAKLDLKEPYYRMTQPQLYAWAQEQPVPQQVPYQESHMQKTQIAVDSGVGQTPSQYSMLVQQQRQQSAQQQCTPVVHMPYQQQQQQQCHSQNYWAA